MEEGGGLELAAVFEEKKLGSVFLGEIETDGAVAADQIAQDTATGAHAVDVMDAEVSAHIQFAPRFDGYGPAGHVDQQFFQCRAFVLDVRRRGGGFDFGVVQTVRFLQRGLREFGPGGGYDTDSQSRIETGRGVLPRMRAERDPDRLAAASGDADPEMIDVGRDSVDFRGESDRFSRQPDEIAVSKTKPRVPVRLFPASVWQSQASVGDGLPSGRWLFGETRSAPALRRRTKQIVPNTATASAAK